MCPVALQYKQRESLSPLKVFLLLFVGRWFGRTNTFPWITGWCSLSFSGWNFVFWLVGLERRLCALCFFFTFLSASMTEVFKVWKHILCSSHLVPASFRWIPSAANIKSLIELSANLKLLSWLTNLTPVSSQNTLRAAFTWSAISWRSESFSTGGILLILTIWAAWSALSIRSL